MTSTYFVLIYDVTDRRFALDPGPSDKVENTLFRRIFNISHSQVYS
jgi:hypothetical protein